MKNLKTFLFVLATIFFFSCESEQEIFEPKQETNLKLQQNYQSKISAYIRRNKLKQKNYASYRAIFNVDNSSEQVTSFALLLEGSGGSLETILKPSGKKDTEGLEIYTWDFDGDGIFEKGEEVKVIATPLNEDGKEMGEPQVLTMTVEGNKQEARVNYIRRGKLKKPANVSSFKATFFVENTTEKLTNFALLLKAGSGDSENCKGCENSLETILKPSGKKTAKGLEIYTWDFDGDGILEKGEEVKVIATPLNEDGKEIGEPQVLIMTVKGNKQERASSIIRKIKARTKKSSYRLSAELDDPKNKVAEVHFLINDLNGLSTSFISKPIEGKIKEDFRFNKTSNSDKLRVIATFKLKNGFEDDEEFSQQVIEISTKG